MRKKVLFVHHYAMVSGAEISLINILRNINESRFEPILCCPEGELVEQLRIADLRFYPCNIPLLKKTPNPLILGHFLLKVVTITLRLLWIITKEQIDTIYANSFTACLFCGPAAKLSRATLIWHMHDLIKHGLFNKLFVSLAGKCSNKVIATTNVMKTNLISCGVSSAKIEVVYNGIDTDEYDRTKINQTQFRDEIGIDANTPLTGIVGQLTPWKGHWDFLQAACIIIKTIPHTRFIIVGDTRLPNNNTYRHKLEVRVKTLGLERNVIFTGFRKDIKNIISSFDILINASSAEPFGMTIIEAMALGVPVIATNAGGVSEIIDDGVNGILFDISDAEQLAQKWINALEKPDFLESIRRNASAIVAEKFLLSNQVNKIENVILSC